MSRVYHTAHKRAKFCNIVRNLVTELVLCEHVKVTKSRKNQVKNTFDKLVTLAKNNTLHDYRQIFQIIRKNVKDDKNVYVLAKLNIKIEKVDILKFII